MDEYDNDEPVTVMSDIVTFFEFMGSRREKTTKSRIQTLVVHTLFTFCMLTCLIPQWLVVASDKYDVFDKAEALSIILPMTRVLVKVLDRILEMDKFWVFYADLQRIHTFNSTDPVAKITLEQRAKVAHLLFKSFGIMYIIIFSMFVIVPFLVGSIFMFLGNPDVLQPIFKAEYLIDTSKNPAFAIVCISQTASAFCSMYVGLMDGVFLSSCVYVHAQVAVVTAEFQSLNDGDNEGSRGQPPIVSRRRIDSNINKEEQITRDIADLKACMQHHSRVIALVDKFSSVFSVQLGLECLMAAGITGLAVFQVTYSTTLAAKAKYLCLATFFYTGIYIQIYYGQKLIDESARLLLAVSELPWTGRGRQYGSLVLQCLQRAQRPLCITGMRLYVISKETFLKLLRATFSYLTIMQSVAEK